MANGARGREYVYIHHDLTRTVSVAMGLPARRKRFRHEHLEALVRELDRAGLLTRARPNSIPEYKAKPFVIERLRATKVYFPPGLLTKALPSLRELVVWVSEPSPEALRGAGDRTWRYDGTFLYVIGSFWQDQGPSSFLSGCSALQIIANVIQGEPFLERNVQEPFGRRSFLHPVEKLKRLGGLVMDVREYEILYRSRYMSDEQCFTDDNRVYRVHDLLAYPIFIATNL
jgi:hypothetical protein